MGFGMAKRANALVADGTITPSSVSGTATITEAPSASQPTTETTDTATVQTQNTQQESADTSRSATEGAGGQAQAPVTDAKTEEAKTQKAEGEPSAEDTAAVNAAVDNDSVETLPLHLQERGRELVAQKKAAIARADTAEKRVAELEAALAANADVTGQSQASTVDGYIAPATLTEQDREQLTQAGFTGPYALEDYQIAQAREARRLKLEKQIEDGELSFQEAKAELDGMDRDAVAYVRTRDIAYREQQLNETEAERKQREAMESAKAASVQALKDYEFADPELLVGYVANGADPKMAAEYLHNKMIPVIERERAIAAESAVAPVKAAYEQQIAELKAAHEAAINKLMGRRAVPSTIGAGSGGTAPNTGTESPKATGRFGFRERALQIRDQTLGIGR